MIFKLKYWNITHIFVTANLRTVRHSLTEKKILRTSKSKPGFHFVNQKLLFKIKKLFSIKNFQISYK